MQHAGTGVAERTASIVEEARSLDGPLLPILHALQDEFGHVPPESLPIVAEALDMSRAEVHGVVTFYHDYRSAPAGRHIVKLCRAEACQAMGADAVSRRVQDALGIGFGETSADGSVTLEAAYCLGLCACAPAAFVDGAPVGRLDNDAIADIVTACAR